MIDLINGLLEFRYLLLFSTVVVEGPVASVAAGWLIAAGQLDFWLAYPIVVGGDLAGDLIYYALGRFGRGVFFINRWGKRFGLRPEKIKGLEQHFEQRGGRTLILGKLLHGIGGAFLVAAGTAKMQAGRFLWYNFVATLPKSLGLILIGYYYGWALSEIGSALSLLSVAGLTIGLSLAYYFLRKKRPL